MVWLFVTVVSVALAIVVMLYPNMPIALLWLIVVVGWGLLFLASKVTRLHS